MICCYCCCFFFVRKKWFGSCIKFYLHCILFFFSSCSYTSANKIMMAYLFFYVMRRKVSGNKIYIYFRVWGNHKLNKNNNNTKRYVLLLFLFSSNCCKRRNLNPNENFLLKKIDFLKTSFFSSSLSLLKTSTTLFPLRKKNDFVMVPKNWSAS